MSKEEIDEDFDEESEGCNEDGFDQSEHFDTFYSDEEIADSFGF